MTKSTMRSLGSIRIDFYLNMVQHGFLREESIECDSFEFISRDILVGPVSFAGEKKYSIKEVCHHEHIRFLGWN